MGSLLIHLSLGVVILKLGKPELSPVRPSAPPSSVEIEVQRSEPPPRAHALQESSPPAKATGASRPRVGHLRIPASQASSSPAAQHGMAVAPSLSGDVPTPLDLTLHAPLQTAGPGGETVANFPGRKKEPPASVAQERIRRWVDDDSASRRVQKGLVDDWFAKLDTALDRALNTRPPPPEVPRTVVANLIQKYGSAAAAYGATGNPGAGARPVGVGAEAKEGALGAALGPPPIFQLQLDPSALDVWAIVELSYDLGGKLSESRVLDSSGNRDFNLHVLHVVAVGLPGFPNVPDAGEGIHPDGTRSVWRVTGRLSFDQDVRKISGKDAWYLPLAAVTSLVGVAPVQFDETTGYVGYTDFRKPHMHCNVELLQVY